MKYLLKKTFLMLLRSLIYPKRALVWMFNKALNGVNRLMGWYRATIGLFFYKVFFRIQKMFGTAKMHKETRGVEFLGKRSTLQIVLFLTAVAVIIPHSKLYTQEVGRIPGRDTLLYKVVGPGDEIEDIEEVNADAGLPIAENPLSWRQGSISIDTFSPASGDLARGSEDITNISTGGSAITKPTILPGNTLSTESSPASSNRTESIKYAVQPGDTIGVIAERFHLDVATILWANNLTSRSYIRPGDQLLILPVDGVTHKVVKGDTVGKIAKLYGAESADIIRQNRLQNDGSDIRIGEELMVPGGEKIQTRTLVTTQPRQYTSLSTIAAPPSSVDTPAGSGYLWPTAARIVTQYFGLRHTGVDIAGPLNTAIYATKAGTVIKSQCGYNGGYGCYIIIDHGGGIQSLYGHINNQGALYVSAGEEVAQGQTIAGIGTTGHSTGPHVHFEIHVNGQRVNPFRYIR